MLMLLESGLGLVTGSKETPKKKGKKRSITDMIREKPYRNQIKGSVKTTKGRKSVEDKNQNKAQGHQIEKRNKYGGY